MRSAHPNRLCELSNNMYKAMVGIPRGARIGIPRYMAMSGAHPNRLRLLCKLSNKMNKNKTMVSISRGTMIGITMSGLLPNQFQLLYYLSNSINKTITGQYTIISITMSGLPPNRLRLLFKLSNNMNKAMIGIPRGMSWLLNKPGCDHDGHKSQPRLQPQLLRSGPILEGWAPSATTIQLKPLLRAPDPTHLPQSTTIKHQQWQARMRQKERTVM